MPWNANGLAKVLISKMKFKEMVLTVTHSFTCTSFRYNTISVFTLTAL